MNIELKRGALYFNKGTKQVERVVEFHKNIVWTSIHKQECKCYPKSNFTIANEGDVANYISQSQR